MLVLIWILIIDTLVVFMKDFFEKVNFENNQQATTKHEKLPSMQRVFKKNSVHLQRMSADLVKYNTGAQV